MQRYNDNLYWGEISLFRSSIAAIIFSVSILLIDMNNIPSIFINKYGKTEMILCLFFLISIVAICFVKRHIPDLRKIPYGNMGDELFIFIIISCMLISISEGILALFSLYKMIIVFVAIIISIIVITFRWHFCKEKMEKATSISTSTIDLGKLISGEAKRYNLPLIFSEEASDYDLLGREGLVNVIYNSIKICNPDHVYVIGLKGAWGSGKTTILNIVKKKIRTNDNKVVIIDDFDPWIFGSQEALLSAMYDTILCKMGIQYSTYSSKQMLRKLKDIVTNKNELSDVLGALAEVEQSDYSSVKQLKHKMATFLKQLEKPILFIIDNLDRAEADNILFLFKLIGSVFDLPNIIYILAYDAERIQEVFSDAKKVNPKYIEKIVQQELFIPDISKDIMATVCSSCIERTLLAYGVSNKDLIQYKDISTMVCENVTDLRQFKRLLNSVFVSTFLYDNELHKPHLLAIESIRFLCPKLFEKIKRNKKYFVSKDIYCSNDDLYKEIIDKKRFNADGKNFFNALFNEYKIFENILANMFPYVKRYEDKADLIPEYVYPDDAVGHNSIASGKYFDLYFSYGTNNFLKIYTSVNMFIEKINSCCSDKIEETTEDAIATLRREEHLEWFERLQNKIDTIEVQVRKYVAAGICNSIRKIDTTRGFLMLSADQRALVVVTKLLKGIDNSAIISLIDDCSKNYNIRLLEEIISNCSAFEKHGDTDYIDLKEIVEAKYYEICHEIIDNNIDIYEKNIYQRWKIWALYHSIPDDKRDVMHRYMRKIVTESNIFKILSDMISESAGTMGYGYYLNKEYIESLFGEKNIIEDILRKVIPSSETEKFILSMWERMESGATNSLGEKDFYSPVPINLIP